MTPLAPFVYGALLLVVAVGVLGAVFVTIIVVQTRPPARPAMGADGVFHLQAHLTPGGQMVAMAPESYGEVVVTGTELIWTSVGGQTWRVPIPALLVHGTRGFLSFSSPGLMLELPGSGTMLLTVSDRPINRFMRNDFKRARESTVARQLADTLVARGARMVAPA